MSDMNFVGKTITGIRLLTDLEAAKVGFEGENVTAVECSDGTLLFPSKDEEGNGPGAFYGINPSGLAFGFFANE